MVDITFKLATVNSFDPIRAAVRAMTVRYGSDGEFRNRNSDSREGSQITVPGSYGYEHRKTSQIVCYASAETASGGRRGDRTGMKDKRSLSVRLARDGSTCSVRRRFLGGSAASAPKPASDPLASVALAASMAPKTCAAMSSPISPFRIDVPDCPSADRDSSLASAASCSEQYCS